MQKEAKMKLSWSSGPVLYSMMKMIANTKKRRNEYELVSIVMPRSTCPETSTYKRT